MTIMNKKSDKSYYDKIDNALEYISNEKNLNKIRNKSLRNFLKFYSSVNMAFFEMLKTDVSIEEIWKIHSYEGASKLLSNIKLETLSKRLENATPELLEITKFEKKDIEYSQRTVYDYMNTLKYIRAVNAARSKIL